MHRLNNVPHVKMPLVLEFSLLVELKALFVWKQIIYYQTHEQINRGLPIVLLLTNAFSSL